MKDEMANQTLLEKAQLALYRAETELRHAMDLLAEWHGNGRSNGSMDGELYAKTAMDSVKAAFACLDSDTVMSLKACDKGGCRCKSYHRTIPAHTHCICGHSDTSHSIPKEIDSETNPR